MKKLFFLAIAFLIIGSTYSQNNNYVTFQVEIANRNSDTIQIRTQKKVLKTIKVDKNGVFKDTLRVTDGIYYMLDGKAYAQMFLKNGYNLKIKLDAQKFKESIVFTGKGENENNYLVKYSISESKYEYEKLLELDEATFKKVLAEKKAIDFAAIDQAKLDPSFTTIQKNQIEKSLESASQYFMEIIKANKLNNTVSQSFDYINYKGGKNKLEDFKGKYVYIDVWATWCGPCRAEIPHLKAIEAKYHDKNIVFVSISIDLQKDFEKWKKFVAEKELGGVQLFADKDWKSEFIKSYNISGIPRFILIDPTGKIVKADAARPSSPNLQKELDSLLN